MPLQYPHIGAEHYRGRNRQGKSAVVFPPKSCCSCINLLPRTLKEAHLKKKILIADDHAIIRYGISSLIRKEFPAFEIVETNNFDDTFYAICNDDFHLVILDINIPGGNNIQTIDTIKQRQPKFKILIFTAYAEQTFAQRYIQAGVDGYLVKDSSDHEIQKAIHTVLDGRTYLSESLHDMLLDSVRTGQAGHDPFARLSNREFDVMHLLIRGMSNAEISSHLNIHHTTVSTYKTRIFEKLQVTTIVEMIERYQLHTNGGPLKHY